MPAWFIFSPKNFPQAQQVNDLVLQTTIDCVPLGFVNREPGLPTTPGWDSPAYVSSLACALRHDNGIGEGLPEFVAYIRKLDARLT